jgi:RNA polymerase primary sigma factor
MSASHLPAPGSPVTGIKKPGTAGRQQIEKFIDGEDFQPSAADLPDSGETAVDPFHKYFDEISAIPLLSKEDEKALAVRVRNGIRAGEELEQDDVRGQKAEKLKNLETQGKLAGRLLFKANLRLVAYLAKDYSGLGLNILDLIQEGNIGLLRAVEKFDHRRETKFSTYAAYWIKQAISRSIAREGHIIRVPEHAIQSINDVKSVQRWLEAEQGRGADCREIALEMGLLSDGEVRKIKDALAGKKRVDPSLEKRWREAADKVDGLIGINRNPISLERPADQDERRSLAEELGDRANPDPLDVVYRGQMNRKLCEIMGALSEQECKVLQMRFGLADGGEMTVDEVADDLGLTPERVRQLETRALRGLRHPDLSNQLKELMK